MWKGLSQRPRSKVEFLQNVCSCKVDTVLARPCFPLYLPPNLQSKTVHVGRKVTYIRSLSRLWERYNQQDRTEWHSIQVHHWKAKWTCFSRIFEALHFAFMCLLFCSFFGVLNHHQFNVLALGTDNFCLQKNYSFLAGPEGLAAVNLRVRLGLFVLPRNLLEKNQKIFHTNKKETACR